MINESTYIKAEAEAQKIFHEAGWVVTKITNYDRVERIVDRAVFQNVVKDTTSFLFKGFGAAITGLSSAALGSVGMDDVDYRA